MSLRDEITNTVCKCLDVNSLSAWELSGALMPLVERAVKEGAIQGYHAGAGCGASG